MKIPATANTKNNARSLIPRFACLVAVVLVTTSVKGEEFSFVVFGDNRAGEYEVTMTPELQSPRFMGLLTDVLEADPQLIFDTGDSISGYSHARKPVTSGLRSRKEQFILERQHYLAAIQALKEALIPPTLCLEIMTYSATSSRPTALKITSNRLILLLTIREAGSLF